MNYFFNLIYIQVFGNDFVFRFQNIYFWCYIYVVGFINGVVVGVKNIGLLYICFMYVIFLDISFCIQCDGIYINECWFFLLLLVIQIDQYWCLFLVVFIVRVVYIYYDVRSFKVVDGLNIIIFIGGFYVRFCLIDEVISYFFGLYLQGVGISRVVLKGLIICEMVLYYVYEYSFGIY